jgi:glucose-6-phosphate isomerase
MVVKIDFYNVGKEWENIFISPTEIFDENKNPFLKFNEETLKLIKNKLLPVKEKFSTMLVCGMGGSSLGAKTINAFAGAFKVAPHKLKFLENIDPTKVEEILESLNWKETVFCFVSKSGTTLETIVFLNLIISELRRRNLSISEHIIFIGDKGKNFEKLAKEFNALFFEIPKEVDGRFSVLTPVGLVPAFFADFNIEELWEGAREVLKEKDENNIAIQLAKIKMYHYLEKNRNISVMFAYGDYLYTFAFWYSQLWAESLGKNNKGQTPLKALGTSDQHSLVQLFREGPDDKIYQFIKADKIKWDLKLPKNTVVFDYIANKTVSQIFNALYEGTLLALIQTNRPIINLRLDEYSAYNLGFLFMLYMVATVASAQILGVNPFGQPGVELGKQLAKKILIEKF